MIGLATLLLWLLDGRIAGISGIFGQIFEPRRDAILWRLAFVAGLVLAPSAYALVHPLPPLSVTHSAALLIGAGLLVGFGTRLSNGCTSGHGICGLARLSKRSLTATAVFMVVAAATVFLARHIHRSLMMPRLFSAFICGLIFGIGLIVAQMSNPAKVLNFLDIAGVSTGTWDPSLAFVMAGAIPVAAIGFILARRRKAPVLADIFCPPSETTITARLVIGAAMFGIGWGLVGFCPGPALTALGFGRSEAAIFVAAMIAGMLLFQAYAAVSAKTKKA